ncbi:MAG TPA: S41 family peptidase [Rhizomicrobium sp.]
MKHLACWFVALVLAAGPALAQPLEKSEKKAVITRAGNLLAGSYIYPDRGREAQARITDALAAGVYDNITDPAAFAERLTDDLFAVLHDKHVFVSSELVPTPPDPSAPPLPPTDGGFARVDRLKGNIGYIRLLNFPMPAIFDPAADAAMLDVADTEALIIDLRDNGGGNIESSSYFSSFFFDPKKSVQLNSVVQRVPGTLRFTKVRYWTQVVPMPYLGKPVYILTNARTFSSAENFAYDLKVRGRALIYGQTTGGAANPAVGRMLNARFGILFSAGRIENPVTGTSWQGVGIAPDMAMDEKHAFQAAVLNIASKRGGLDDIKGQLANQTDEDPFVEEHLMEIPTAPRPGSEAALRRNIEDIVQGTASYKLMSNELAETIRLQRHRLQDLLTPLGPIRSVTFKYVSSQGLDVFDVIMAHGLLQSGIFVEPNGKVETMWMRPAPAMAADAPR